MTSFAAGRISKPSRSAGFTLVELIVALAIAVIALGVAPVALGRMYDTMQYRSTVREMMSELKAARLLAVRRGQPTVFTVDAEAHRFGVGSEPARVIPSKLKVRTIVADSEVDADGRAGIRFYADGSATGGSIELARPGGGGLRLRVDWLLGRVSQEPLGG